MCRRTAKTKTRSSRAIGPTTSWEAEAGSSLWVLSRRHAAAGGGVEPPPPGFCVPQDLSFLPSLSKAQPSISLSPLEELKALEHAIGAGGSGYMSIALASAHSARLVRRHRPDARATRSRARERALLRLRRGTRQRRGPQRCEYVGRRPLAAVRRCDLCGNHSELGYAIEQTQEWRQPRVDGVGSNI